MHLRPSLLFLISISFLLFTSATGRVVHGSEQPNVVSQLDIHAKLAEFVAFLDPTSLADRTQASLLSIHHDSHLAENLDGVQFEPQVSLGHPDDRPDIFHQSLEALISEEMRKLIRSIETVVNSTIALGMAFYDSASADSTRSGNAPLGLLLKNVTMLVAIARDDFRERFPFPASASGHAERVKSVSVALGHFERILVRFARNHEIGPRVVVRYFTRARPFLHEVGVFIGDVSELYPAASEALVLNLSAVLLPEAVFLRSLVILYCFGPYVLGRDAISGWLLKRFSEALNV